MAGKGDKRRPGDLKKYDRNFVKIFGEGNSVDGGGCQVGLSSRTKNTLYREAKGLREKIKDNLCSKDECKDPNDKNVKKMINGEFKIQDDIQKYKKCMQAIGADPNDCNPERWRR